MEIAMDTRPIAMLGGLGGSQAQPQRKDQQSGVADQGAGGSVGGISGLEDVAVSTRVTAAGGVPCKLPVVYRCTRIPLFAPSCPCKLASVFCGLVCPLATPVSQPLRDCNARGTSPGISSHGGRCVGHHRHTQRASVGGGTDGLVARLHGSAEVTELAAIYGASLYQKIGRNRVSQ